jgi:hypothetical protein
MPEVAESVALETRPACIVDVRLALGPHGMRVAAALCAHADVWLPQALHELLCDPGGLLLPAERLVPRLPAQSVRDLDEREDAAAIEEERSLWARRIRDPSLAALPFYYLGARANDCRTPANADRGLRDRCEQLQVGLDLLATRSGFDLPRGEAVAACVRDAAALCAALGPTGAWLLTRIDRDGFPQPAICAYFAAWGLRCHEVPARGGRAGRVVRGAIAKANLLPLVPLDLRLAAVHLAVPGIPVGGLADARLQPSMVARCWERAFLGWHEVC